MRHSSHEWEDHIKDFVCSFAANVPALRSVMPTCQHPLLMANSSVSVRVQINWERTNEISERTSETSKNGIGWPRQRENEAKIAVADVHYVECEAVSTSTVLVIHSIFQHIDIANSHIFFLSFFPAIDFFFFFFFAISHIIKLKSLVAVHVTTIYYIYVCVSSKYSVHHNGAFINCPCLWDSLKCVDEVCCIL